MPVSDDPAESNVFGVRLAQTFFFFFFTNVFDVLVESDHTVAASNDDDLVVCICGFVVLYSP